MDPSKSQDNGRRVTLRAVSSENWRDVAALQVTTAQQAFVAEPS